MPEVKIDLDKEGRVAGAHLAAETVIGAGLVAEALTAYGFAAHTERRGNELRIVSEHCPFGAAAVEHPVICAVDRGMVKGMLGALCGDTDVTTEASLPRGDTFCATTF